MGKNRSASGLTNVIQYDNNGNITFVSGSTTTTAIPTSVLNGNTIVYGSN